MRRPDAAGVRRAAGAAWRRMPAWAPLLLGATLGLVCGTWHAALAEREFAAEGYVQVTAAEGDAIGVAQAYGRMATGGAVLSAAAESAGVAAGRLADRVRAATSPDAPMIEITGTGPNGAAAARAANAVAGALVDLAGPGTRLTQVLPAAPPATPIAPVPPLSIALGVCAGAVAGGAASLVRRGETARSEPGSGAALGAAVDLDDLRGDMARGV
ncbi:lipopolysaccharide biosynthesis protein [Streptomyces sp. PT12]|uniref:lipopolysaccharide biosynthesis protein n=1 Tax=Streptomyces sp. PT12 TaxID=1510197 RepID=UPI0011BE5366|nr:lipopolysaccharide biosynthesis protein [Streptomyces sp. PT12]